MNLEYNTKEVKMKRKLKPLHVILSENEYILRNNPSIFEFRALSFTTHIYNLLIYNENVMYPESFLESIPEQDYDWFRVDVFHYEL